jgi:RNA recognition motif-containing protein
MSSSSSASPEPSTPQTLKRKRKIPKAADPDDSDEEDSDSPDELVLSHAERRRQKKREQALAADASVPKKRKLQDGAATPVVSTKRQNSVWVGNMSFKTTLDDLRTFFGGVGEITRINMPTKAPAGPGRTSENRG